VIAKMPNSAQLEGTPTPKFCIRVCAVVWECGEGQTHRSACVIYDSCEM